MTETPQPKPSPGAGTRTERRRAARSALVRHALTTTAVVSIGATALTFAALAAPAKPAHKSAVALPSGKAAAAAFLSGLRASGATTYAQPLAAAGTQIAIKNYAFSPAAVTVSAGTKVTWTNDDTAPHTVTVSSGPVKFSSPTLQKGDSFTYTFTTPGTYTYYCAVHPDMTAKVVVAGSPTTTPTPTPTGSTPVPTPSTSTSMPMPGPSGSDCAVSGALQTFLTHVNSAHLDESPAQQVSDILDIDSYIGNHLKLFERMLEPLTAGGASSALSSGVQTFLTHLNSAHLDESPAQQVSDILDVNQYIGNHLALFQRMASGFEDLAC
jgi:plastocyanin